MTTAADAVNTTGKKRIESIDVLRGLAMVIMALDHVRDYFHITASTDDPLNLQTTSAVLFFTRWITHFCAPTFVFLSGTSIYLQSLRKTKSQLSAFLIKRGLWLVLVEVLIVTFGWTFNPHFNFLVLQVIWAIGISMFLLGFIIRLPFKIILLLGLLIVLGHNLLDIPEADPNLQAGFWWDLLHHGMFKPYFFADGHAVLIVYPFLAWTGLMILGYCAGKFYSSDFTAEKRRKILSLLGLGAIAFFVVLRFINVYGDPDPWSVQQNGFRTFLSFIKLHKYPPSLLYMCMTIGPLLLLLAWLENTRNRFTDILRIYGRVAFFYYILHIYLIHFFEAIAYFARGHSFSEGCQFPDNGPPFYFMASAEGYRLYVVYIVWFIVLLILYPLCKWYDNYKSTHREKWWLSYL